MSQVLGENARARLVLLPDLTPFHVFARGGLVPSRKLLERSSGLYVNLRRSELGVVQEQGGLGRGLLLEGHRGRFGGVGIVARRGDGKSADFPAVDTKSQYKMA